MKRILNFIKAVIRGFRIGYSEPLTIQYLANYCFGCKTKFEKPVKIYQGEKLYCQECAKNINL